MRASTLIGIILIVLGGLGLVFGGVSYTDRDEVDLGPVDVAAEREERVPVPPIVSGLALVGGVALLAAGARRRST